VDKGTSVIAFGNVRTRMNADYTDLHELELQQFNSWPFAKIRG
jgi:hypothetical protein